MTLCEIVESGPTAEAQPAALDLPEGVPPLHSLYLYLVSGCNLACRHCWITPTFVPGTDLKPGEYLALDLLRQALREARPLGLQSAKLTGGEPLLHPDFVQVVDLLTAEDLDMDMETNGTLIDAELARHLKEETRLTFVSVSLDGARAETHDAFRGVPGSFEDARQGLDHLVEAGYQNVQVIMSPHRGNVAELEALVELAIQHGAGSVKFNPVTRSGRGIAMHERGEALGYEEVLELAHHVLGDLQDRTPIRLFFSLPPALQTVRELLRLRETGGSCRVGNILGLLSGGEMALCGIGRNVEALCFGQVGRDSLREVWSTHPTLIQLRQDLADVKHYPGVCGDCIHASGCLTHCVAQNYLDSGQLVWPTSLCAEADRRGAFPPSRRRSTSGA